MHVCLFFRVGTETQGRPQVLSNFVRDEDGAAARVGAGTKGGAVRRRELLRDGGHPPLAASTTGDGIVGRRSGGGLASHGEPAAAAATARPALSLGEGRQLEDAKQEEKGAEEEEKEEDAAAARWLWKGPGPPSLWYALEMSGREVGASMQVKLTGVEMSRL